VREWGQEQLVRDTRIAQIYEGTNGIQALDLLGRKVFGSQGKLLQPFNEEIQSFLDETATGNEWIQQREQLQQALNILNGVSEEVLQKAAGDENLVNSVAVEYLHLVGYVSYAYLWLKMAIAAEPLVSEKPYLATKTKTARFYFARILPRIHSLALAIKDGSESLYLHSDDDF